jgi:hypothetical protein
MNAVVRVDSKLQQARVPSCCACCRRQERKSMPSPVSSIAVWLLAIASTGGHVTAFAFRTTDVHRGRCTNLAAHPSREPSPSERKHELSHLAVAAAIVMTMAASPFPAFADGAYRMSRRGLSTNVESAHDSRPMSHLARFNQRVQVPSH